MNRQVWKILLATEVGEACSSEHQLPFGFKVLKIDCQYDQVTAWVEVHPGATKVTATFWVVGTGRDVPEGTAYVGTAILHRGQLVAHVYK